MRMCSVFLLLDPCLACQRLRSCRKEAAYLQVDMLDLEKQTLKAHSLQSMEGMMLDRLSSPLSFHRLFLLPLSLLVLLFAISWAEWAGWSWFHLSWLSMLGLPMVGHKAINLKNVSSILDGPFLPLLVA